MQQKLHKFAVAAGTGNHDRLWFGIMAQDKPRAIEHAQRAWQNKVRKLNNNERLLVEVRT